MENTRVHKAAGTQAAMNMIQFWPGTSVQKSLHNEFNWQGQPSKIMQLLDMRIINTSKLQKINVEKKP